MRITSWLALVIGLAAAGPVFAADAKPPPASGYLTVEPTEFARLAADTNHVVLDVRTPMEFRTMRLDRAVNLDWNAPDFAARVTKLDKDKTYLVYCAVGGRSAAACRKLKDLGFTHLFNMQGGIKGWRADGKPVLR